MGIGNLFKSILGMETDDRREQMYSALDNTKDVQMKALMQENSALKAQIGRLFADKRQQAEIEQATDKEQIVIKDLREQQVQIKREKYGATSSLLKLGQILLNNPKLKEAIELTDKDDKVVFGKLGDIGITEKDGFLVIIDSEGNILSVGRRLKDIIYKPESIGNQIKRKRIALPRYSDGKPVIAEMEEVEMNDIMYDAEKKEYRETEEYQAKARVLLQRRDDYIRQLSEDKQRLEQAQVLQSKKIADLERTLTVHKNIRDLTESQLSQTMNNDMQLINKVGDFNKKIVILQDQNHVLEMQNTKLKNIIDGVLSKMEKAGDKTQFEIVKNEVYEDLAKAKNLLPETIIEKVEPPKPQQRMPSPGEVINSNGVIPR